MKIRRFRIFCEIECQGNLLTVYSVNIVAKHRSQIHKSPYEAKKAYEDVIYQKQQAFLRTHKVFIDKR